MLSLRLALDRLVEGTVEDTSGRRWTATCRGLKIIPDREGRFVGCAAFDGERSKITIPGIHCSQQFTFSLWARRGPGLTFYFATLLAFSEDSPYFGLHRGRPVLGQALTLPDEIGDTWTHLAVTQDHRESRIYVDGELAASTISRTSVVGRGLGIGCDLTRGRSFFQGEMAQIQIFDAPLSEAGVRQAMNELHASGPRSARTSRRPLPIDGKPHIDAVHPAPREPIRVPSIEPIRVPSIEPVLILPMEPVHAPSTEPVHAPSTEPRHASSAPEIHVSERLSVVDLRTTQPAPSPMRTPAYDEQIAFLRALQAAFPAEGIAEVLRALESRTEPLARSIGLSGNFTLAEGGSLQAEVGPFSLGGSGVEIVELSRAGDGRAAEVRLDMRPATRDKPGWVSARIRGHLRLLGGALSADIDEAFRPDGGLTFSLQGAEGPWNAQATVGLRSSERCALSLGLTFSHTIGVRGHEIDLPLSTLIGVTIDGDTFRQSVAYTLDLAGEVLRVIANPPRPIGSLREIPEVFRRVALAEMEQRISEALVHRGAAALRWLGQKQLETVERDLLDAAGRALRK